MFLGYDAQFWISVGAAAVVKYTLGPTHSLWRSLITGFAGIWCAWTFTQPIVIYVGVSDNIYYIIAVAGTLTLTGDNIARNLIHLSQNPKEIVDLINHIRGRGNSK